MTLQTTELDFEALPPDHAVLAVMGLSGDTKHMWDKSNPEEVAAARKLFVELKGKGFLAFRVVTYKKGDRTFAKKGEALSEFDPEAGRMRLQPPANAEEVPSLQGEPAETFDPNASHVLVPPMSGG